MTTIGRRPTRIREVRLAEAAPIAIGAEFKNVVHAWNYHQNAHLASFPTVHDSGCCRIALSPDGKTVFAAAYDAGLVAAYSASTGECIWLRKDIRKVHRLHASNQFLGVSVDGLSSFMLRADSGMTEARIVRTNEVWDITDSGFVVGENSKEVFIYDWPTLDVRARIPMTSGSVLDVAISNSAIIISEMNYKVRAFSKQTIEQIWEFDEPNERNMTALFPVRSSDMMYAFAFRTKEPYRSLVGRFDCTSGEFVRVLEPVRLFAQVNKSGNRMVLTEGEVYSIGENSEVELMHKLDWN